MRPEAAIAITVSLICCAILITSLEQLARFRDLAPFLSLRLDPTSALPARRVVRCLLIVRAALAAMVIFSILTMDSPTVTVVALTLLTVASIVVNVIRPLGGDGADQLQLVVIASTSLCYLLTDAATAARWAAIYITFQIMLSYVTTGTAKLTSEVWRKGDVLVRILSTYGYGHPQMAGMLARNAWLNRAGTWGPMLLFSVAPAFLVQPSTDLLLVYLTLTFAFHVGTGVFMGLNNFVISFPATYPCVIYSHTYLHSQLQDLSM